MMLELPPTQAEHPDGGTQGLGAARSQVRAAAGLDRSTVLSIPGQAGSLRRKLSKAEPKFSSSSSCWCLAKFK